jgi:hypothetical protein
VTTVFAAYEVKLRRYPDGTGTAQIHSCRGEPCAARTKLSEGAELGVPSLACIGFVPKNGRPDVHGHT